MLDIIKKYGLIISIAIIVIALILFTQPKTSQVNHSFEDENSLADELTNEVNQAIITSTVVVDVKGEVNKPGVYEIDHDARVHDVITLAGGFTEEADQFPVNLAQKVYDEMIIIVPKIGTSSKSAADATGNNKIRINLATQEEIESLNGIGPAKAQAIIQYREENGPFQHTDDLLNVSGIGEKTLESLKDDIQIP